MDRTRDWSKVLSRPGGTGGRKRWRLWWLTWRGPRAATSTARRSRSTADSRREWRGRLPLPRPFGGLGAIADPGVDVAEPACAAGVTGIVLQLLAALHFDAGQGHQIVQHRHAGRWIPHEDDASLVR